MHTLQPHVPMLPTPAAQPQCWLFYHHLQILSNQALEALTVPCTGQHGTKSNQHHCIVSNTCTNTHPHPHTHTHTHPHTHPPTHTHTHTHPHTHTPTHTHTHTHTHPPPHTHTHTHTVQGPTQVVCICTAVHTFSLQATGGVQESAKKDRLILSSVAQGHFLHIQQKGTEQLIILCRSRHTLAHSLTRWLSRAAMQTGVQCMLHNVKS